MTMPEEILLSASAEMANWARHYDAARIQLVGLIVALSGAAVSYAIGMAEVRIRKLLLVVTASVGVALTVLSTEYTRLYYERSSAEHQLLQLAVEYQQELEGREAWTFSKFKIDKKVFESYFEAFGESGPCVKGLDDKSAARKIWLEYGGFGVLNWRWAMLPRLASSFWLWLSLGVGFMLPAACLILGIGRRR